MNTKISTDWDGKIRTLFEKQCQLCLTDYWVPKHFLNKSKFCSKKCSSKAISNKRTKIITCINCKKQFKRHNNKIKKFNFCSRQCKEFCQSYKSKDNSIKPSHYKNKSYNIFKKTICYDCGETKNYLLICHHIDGNRLNNNESNIETVCANCHIKRHLKLINNNWIYNSKYLTPRELLKDL